MKATKRHLKRSTRNQVIALGRSRREDVVHQAVWSSLMRGRALKVVKVVSVRMALMCGGVSTTLDADLKGSRLGIVGCCNDLACFHDEQPAPASNC